MKKLFLFITIISLFSFSLTAQQNVYLKINHQMNGVPFTFNQATSNNLGDNFTFTRLHYYISQIKLTHSNGQVTLVPNTWILVDASQVTNVLLGSFSISNLTAVEFAVGVESAVNHNDPSLWSSNHPLAPLAPSMHWGWSAGYRFVAVEGNTGVNLNQIFQVHALGDRNYIPQTINTTGYIQNGDLIIELDADYSEAFNGITVNSNLLNHGEFNEAATLLSNFSTRVFSQTTVGLNETDSKYSFSVSPNPSEGNFFLDLSAVPNADLYIIRDIQGREVKSERITELKNQPVVLDQSGVFLIDIYNDDNELLVTQKLVVQ